MNVREIYINLNPINITIAKPDTYQPAHIENLKNVKASYEERLLELGYFPIGHKYMSLGKHPRECIVIDVHFTYNTKDELVNVVYVACHEFMGQTVNNYNVPKVSIQRGAINA